ncbi:MAG: hypothetical protein ACREV4_10850 [Gammaproteobacteria bacterium]
MQHHAPLLRRESGEGFGVRLLDCFRRCSLKEVAVASDGLSIGELSGLLCRLSLLRHFIVSEDPI